jgi:hypothetical protein
MPYLGCRPNQAGTSALARGAKLGFHDRSLNGAGGLRKNGVRIGSDEPNCAHNDDEDRRQHNRIFGDILAFVIRPECSDQGMHRNFFGSGGLLLGRKYFRRHEADYPRFSSRLTWLQTEVSDADHPAFATRS